jgi:perosamine synthetase
MGLNLQLSGLVKKIIEQNINQVSIMFSHVFDFIRSVYGEGQIPLHAPVFSGNEKKYVLDCIDSTFVSSVGAYVNRFEQMTCDFTGSKYTVATMNGTAALHMALILADIKRDDEVITQSLTFVATANAIKYNGAFCVFLDSAKNNLGMCPKELDRFLSENCVIDKDGHCLNKITKRKIKACVPMHVFGHPVLLDEIIEICSKFNITVIEDAAESLGSYYKSRHTGTIAPIGVLSFNGNKIVTSGGGGALLIQNKELAQKAKHLTTTAKIPHPWEFMHDEIGYNYRMPNLNAALLCAQFENLDLFLKQKRAIASKYEDFFKSTDFQFVSEPNDSKSNYWLNAILAKDQFQRDEFLKHSNAQGIMTRPIWELMTSLRPFQNDVVTSEFTNAKMYHSRIVNIPSGPREIL